MSSESSSLHFLVAVGDDEHTCVAAFIRTSCVKKWSSHFVQ